MAGASYFKFILIICFFLGCANAQICSNEVDATIFTNTSVNSLSLTCAVPLGLQILPGDVNQDTWEWQRNAIPIQPQLAEAAMSRKDISPVSCSGAGQYVALYNAANGTCLQRCSFTVEIEETQMSVISNIFSSFDEANLTDDGSTLFNGAPSMSIEAGNLTEVLVGTCDTVFRQGFSGCFLQVSGQWYKDGTQLDLSDPRYEISSGQLRIAELTEGTAGSYACVTTLPDNLGDFITSAVGVAISQSSLSTDMSTGTEAPPTSSPLGLRDWEIALITINAFIVALLILVLMIGLTCYVARRKRPRNRGVDRANPRPNSELPLMEIENEAEEVDAPGPVEIPFSCILFEELLHKGTFKVVHHAIVNYPTLGIMSQPAAVKRLRNPKSELGLDELRTEYDTLKALQEKAGPHPNVVNLVGITTEGSPTCLLLEYIPYGRLDDFLLYLREGPIPAWYTRYVKDSSKKIAYHKQVASDLMRVILQVAEAMEFLTDNGFIHRDLSTRTVLVGERLNIKVADPGMTHEGYYYVVTEREDYLQDMAPECLWEKRYSVWSDIWSFGILAYKVIAMESLPFPDATVSDMYDRMVGGERPQLLASFSNEMYFLLQRCWQFIATERPTFNNIISDLKDMAEKPHKHIILKVAKDHETGYISDTGQVFLHPLPLHVIDEPKTTSKRNWRLSGTQQSIAAASSVNETMYTRETVETTVDSVQSEDDFTNYLRGDAVSSTSEDDDEKVRQNRQTTRLWVDTAGTKVYTPSDEASDEAVVSKKKKKRGKQKKGFNPLANVATKSDAINRNPNNSNRSHEQEGSGSSHDPPSVTEEEGGAKTSNPSESSKQHSREDIVNTK